MKNFSAIICLLLVSLFTSCGGTKFTTVTFSDGSRVVCEVADTPDSQRAGLTVYETLEEDQGMIFVYPEEKNFTSFWMPADMNFRIDILFVDSNKQINTIHRNIPICKSNNELDCPSYVSNRPTKYVIEVVAGFCDARGIKIGDAVDFDLP
jgi:uncharacterized membrane protein (UPF0127 family)